MNLYRRILDASRGHEHEDAFRFRDGDAVTHEALHGRVGRLAARLDALGVGPGDRVAVQVDKSVDAVVLYLATLRAGAVFLPLNNAYTPAEVARFVEDAEPALLVCTPERSVGAPPPGARTMATLGAGGEGSLLEGIDGGVELAPVERDASDLAAILYTSGTTGRSKGAMLTHANLASNADALRRIWGWCADDVLLHVLPIHHAHGLFVALHCPLLQPSPILFLDRFDAAEVVAALPDVSVMMGVPTHYVRLLEVPELDAARCASMRLFVSGSAPLREETFAAFEARTGHRILERYGMTEAGMITSNPLDGVRLAGSVGWPLPDVRVRVRGEDGAEVEPGGVGVLQIRGPNVFAGYWGMPERTAAEFDDGWFVTGDLVQRDDDGRLRIVGRAKDLIISGGLNVYPKEVEIELDQEPGVIESAVFGVPHPDFGEAVVAVAVVAQDWAGEAGVVAALRERLAPFKVPKRVMAVPELPRNAMGKVQKNALRAEYGALFGP